MAEPKSSAIDNPIIDDAFKEPTRWWDFLSGQPTLSFKAGVMAETRAKEQSKIAPTRTELVCYEPAGG